MFWHKADNPDDELQDAKVCVPDRDTLVNLFAELSEPADINALDNAFQSPAPAGTVVLCRYTKSGKLAGVLRAWRAPVPQGGAALPDRPGIIYDVAVRGGFAGKGVGSGLVAALEQKFSETKWNGNPARVAPTLDRALAIIRTIYAISLVFGFQKLFESGYLLWFGDDKQTAGGHKIELFCLMFVVALLGFRFFWAVGNLRRFVLCRIFKLKPTRRRPLLLFHVPVLFAHALLFYYLCRFVQDFCPPKSMDAQHTDGFVFVFVIFMMLNVVWLMCLRDKRTDQGPEFLWLGNNLCTGAAAIICLAVCRHFQVKDDLVLWYVSGLLFANSLIDLIATEDSYILSDAFAGG